MKNYIYLAYLFVITGCLGNNSTPSWLRKWKDPHGLDAQAERPCPLYDLNCIRRYFTTHSHCKVVNGRVPDPFLVPQLTVPLPSTNITVVTYDSLTSGLNGRVTEFSINRKTNNVVFSVRMTNIIIYSPTATFRYHRLRKETIALSDGLYVNYGNVTLTAVFHNTDNLVLEKMQVFSYIENNDPPYALGPGLIKTKDRDAIRCYNTMVTNLPQTIKEVFVVRGPLLMTEFIQRTICDFRTKVIP